MYPAVCLPFSIPSMRVLCDCDRSHPWFAQSVYAGHRGKGQKVGEYGPLPYYASGPRGRTSRHPYSWMFHTAELGTALIAYVGTFWPAWYTQRTKWVNKAECCQRECCHQCNRPYYPTFCPLPLCPAYTLCVNQGWKRSHNTPLTEWKRAGIRYKEGMEAGPGLVENNADTVHTDGVTLRLSELDREYQDALSRSTPH